MGLKHCDTNKCPPACANYQQAGVWGTLCYTQVQKVMANARRMAGVLLTQVWCVAFTRAIYDNMGVPL